MGTFRVEIQAAGNHGCQREVKSGHQVKGCGHPSCVDCITREFVGKLSAAGVHFGESTDHNNAGYAQITHWPGGHGTVTDNLLTGVRSGNF